MTKAKSEKRRKLSVLIRKKLVGFTPGVNPTKL
jgi:hypothetical protein